ncbi:MAG: hypothetical protein LBL46_00525 [Rickettsiales bacterium]|jgi:hypothetical protein|nr:hypothetical protein [Rickettsiales bacterium]
MKKQISNEQRAMSNGIARKGNNKFLLLIASCALLITGGAQGAKMCLKSNSCAAGSWTIPSSFSVSDFVENNGNQTISFQMSGHSFALETKCGGAAAPESDAHGAPVGIAVGAGASACNSCWVRLLSIDGNAKCYGQWYSIKAVSSEINQVKDGTKTCGFIIKYMFATYPYVMRSVLQDYSL